MNIRFSSFLRWSVKEVTAGVTDECLLALNESLFVLVKQTHLWAKWRQDRVWAPLSVIKIKGTDKWTRFRPLEFFFCFWLDYLGILLFLLENWKSAWDDVFKPFSPEISQTFSLLSNKKMKKRWKPKNEASCSRLYQLCMSHTLRFLKLKFHFLKRSFEHKWMLVLYDHLKLWH